MQYWAYLEPGSNLAIFEEISLSDFSNVSFISGWMSPLWTYNDNTGKGSSIWYDLLFSVTYDLLLFSFLQGSGSHNSNWLVQDVSLRFRNGRKTSGVTMEWLPQVKELNWASLKAFYINYPNCQLTILHKRWWKSSIPAIISEISSEKGHTKEIAFIHFQGEWDIGIYGKYGERKTKLLPSSQQLHLEKEN